MEQRRWTLIEFVNYRPSISLSDGFKVIFVGARILTGKLTAGCATQSPYVYRDPYTDKMIMVVNTVCMHVLKVSSFPGITEKRVLTTPITRRYIHILCLDCNVIDPWKPLYVLPVRVAASKYMTFAPTYCCPNRIEIEHVRLRTGGPSQLQLCVRPFVFSANMTYIGTWFTCDGENFLAFLLPRKNT